MNKEELTRALKHIEKKHRNDTVNTFGTDISMMCADVLRVLKNCIEIPEGATNGEVIKMLFQNYTFKEVHFLDGFLGDVMECQEITMYFELSWWNALYKAESEDKE